MSFLWFLSSYYSLCCDVWSIILTTINYLCIIQYTMAKQLDLTTSLGKCLVGMRYILVDITLNCNMYIIDIDASTFSLRDITYEPHLGVNNT